MATRRAIVVGYGSIGCRHAEVLSSLNYEVAVVSRRELTGSRYHRFPDLRSALAENPASVVVLATETSLHRGGLAELNELKYPGRVLVEKPLLAQLDAPFIQTLAPELKARIFVGYNLRFHPLVKLIREEAKKSALLSAWLYCGQYLPNWRPGRNYENVYSASADQGGGVLRDLSHEIDFIHWVFPRFQLRYARGGHWSALKTDADDHFILEFATPEGSLGLHLNAVDRLMQRRWTFNFSHDSLAVDLNSGEARRSGEVIQFPVERNQTYEEMHRALMEPGPTDLCTLVEAERTLETIGAAESVSRAVEKGNK